MAVPLLHGAWPPGQPLPMLPLGVGGGWRDLQVGRHGVAVVSLRATAGRERGRYSTSVPDNRPQCLRCMIMINNSEINSKHNYVWVRIRMVVCTYAVINTDKVLDAPTSREYKKMYGLATRLYISA